MSAKAVREYHGKKLLARHVASHGQHVMDDRSVLITPNTNMETLVIDEPWLVTELLVVKPDQLIKRRGKAGLVGARLDWPHVQEWIAARMQREICVEGSVTGELDHFIVEPFVPHEQSDEYYICIQSDRDGEEILFCAEGGVDVGNVDEKAARLHVPIDDIDNDLDIDSRVKTTLEQIRRLVADVPEDRQASLASFIHTLFLVYRKLNFVYMEINPIVFASNGAIVPLDLAAKIDETKDEH
jgi:ATP citrate (pro-S)-lyase